MSFRLVWIVAVVCAALVHASNVLDLTTTSAYDATVGKGTGVLVEYFAPWCGHCKTLAPIYEQLADSFATKKDRVLIAKVDADANKELGRRVGLRGFPTLKWFPPHAEEGVDYNGARTAEALAQFITEQSNVRSRLPPPEAPAVVELHADNFDALVMDKEKDVLVEFYAPWCSHCKSLAPVYESVAKIFRRDPTCVVAKLDADDEKNAAIKQRYQIKSFPTLLFFPAGEEDKWPRPYLKERTAADLTSFLNEKCFTFRNADGSLTQFAGRLPSLDGLAARFYTAAADARDAIVAEARRFTDELSTKENSSAKTSAASYYLRVMDKALHDGNEYVKREQARIQALLARHAAGTSKFTEDKVDQLQRKSNVLAAFANERIASLANRASSSMAAASTAEHDEL